MITQAFEKELTAVLNSHSIDALCNIPDYLLAEYIVRSLDSLQKMNRATTIWRGNGGKANITLGINEAGSTPGSKKS
jgi:hypothetical protein